MQTVLLLISAVVALQLRVSIAGLECTGTKCVLQNFFLGPWLDAKPCTLSKVFYPTTEPELVQAVAYAVEHKQKVKVATRSSHTQTKFACPNNENGDGIVISTSKYNSSMVLDKEAMTATVDSGLELRAFLDWLGSQGFALPQTIAFDGVSVAGMISTGSHGSGLLENGGGTAEYVVGLRLVVPAKAEEGFAKVIQLTSSDKELFEAARISVGVLGAISKVTFAVQPMFKMSVRDTAYDDATLENDILTLARAHEGVEILWYPSVKKFIARTFDRVPVSTPGEGVYRISSFLPRPGYVRREAREREEMRQASGNATGYCTGVQNGVSRVNSSGGGLLNDGKKFTGFPVVGYIHNLQAAGGCQYAYENKTNLALPEDDRLVCGWDYQAHGTFFYHMSISIGLPQLGSFIRDIRNLRDQVSASRLCMIDAYGGLEFRFMKASKAYLGPKEDVAMLEYLAFRDRTPAQPQTYEDVVEEIEQILLYKYKGKPHFGKNRPLAFKDLANKVTNMTKFLEARQKIDPEGWFSSAWSDAVLGIRGVVVSDADGCALDGLCVCSEDRHCAPDKGFLCQAGVVYQDARVCTYVQALVF